MEVQDVDDVRMLRLTNEIKYYMAYSAIKKLLENGAISKEIYRKTNVALAEMYGVLRYNI